MLVNPTQFVDNTTHTAAQHNDPINEIAEAINGGLSNENIAPDAAISSSKIAFNSTPGLPVQVVSAASDAVATGTILTPLDDTIPQNTEGNEFITLAITPESAANKLVIEANVVFAHSAIAHVAVALFQDSIANALAAVPVLEPTANGALVVKLEHPMTAGTTSSTTFKIRIGADTAGTTTFNGRAGARLYGAITKSSIKITEYMT